MTWLLSWPWWAVLVACWLPFGVLVGWALGRLDAERYRQAEAASVERMLAAYDQSLTRNGSLSSTRTVVAEGMRASHATPGSGAHAEDTIREVR